MYCNFFGLRNSPFEDRPDAQFFCAIPAHEDILRTMEYEAQHGRGVSVLVGEVGAGKTLLVRTLLPRLNATDQVTVLTAPANGALDVLREACKGLGITLPSSGSRVRCLARLRRHLTRTAKADGRVILIIDQAENLSAEALTDVSTLADLQANEDVRFMVMLVGQPQLRARLDQPECMRLGQQVHGDHTVPSLSPAETEQYIQDRLRVAGAGETSLFDTEAVALIHQGTGGIPRAINRMCHAAMLAAYRAEQARVTEAVASTVSEKAERSASAREVGASLTALLGEPVASTSWVGPAQADYAGNAQGAGSIGSDAVRYAASGPPSGCSTLSRNGRGEELAGTIESLLVQGEMFLERLERGVAMADHAAAVVEASSAEQAGWESRLTALIENAEKACERSDRVEERLTAFAEELADRGDRVQQSIAQLMTGLDASDELKGKLQTILAQISAESTGAQEAAAAQCRKLQEGIEEGERTHERLTETAWRECRARIDDYFSGLARDHDETAKETRTTIQAAVDEALCRTSDAERRLQQLLEQTTQTSKDAEQRICAMIDRAADSVSHVDVAVAAQQAAAEEALREVEQVRKTFVDSTLHDARMRLAEALAAQQSSMREEVQAAQEELQSLLQQTSTAVAEAERTVKGCATDLNERAEAVDGMHKQLASAALARFRQQLQTASETASQDLETIRNEITSATTDGRETLKECEHLRTRIAEDLRREITELTSAAQDRFQQQLQEAYEAACDDLETIRAEMKSVSDEGRDALKDCQHLRAGIVEDVRRDVSEINSRLETVRSRQAEVDSTFTTLANGVEATDQRLSEMSGVVKRMQIVITDESARADTAAGSLAEVLERGEDMLRSADKCYGQIETMQRNVAGVLVEIGTAHERLVEIHEQNQYGQQVIARLESARTDAEQVDRRLRDMVMDANNVRDAVQRIATDAESKIGPLASHTAAAGHLLGELGEANKNGHELIQKAGEAQKKLAAVNIEVASLAELSENAAHELTEGNTRAEQLISQMQEGTVSASNISSELAGRIDIADREIKRVKTEADKAGGLVDRLQRISRILATAKEVDGCVRKAVDEARAAHGELAIAVDNAIQQTAKLQDASATAGELVETQARLNHESEVSTIQLSEYVESAESTAEAGERLLNEFATQCETLRDELQALERKASQIDESVQQMSAKPSEIVASAQAQAAQLERVCAAVRKVFAGLWQASQEAKKSADESKDLNRRAVERLSLLSAETDQASNALREWVEEAMRVQTRLENTLKECPSLSETHSVNSLRRMSQLSSPLTRDGEAGPASRLRMLSEPKVREASKPKAEVEMPEPVELREEERPQPGPTRLEEVSRIIEGAKRHTLSEVAP